MKINATQYTTKSKKIFSKTKKGNVVRKTIRNPLTGRTRVITKTGGKKGGKEVEVSGGRVRTKIGKLKKDGTYRTRRGASSTDPYKKRSKKWKWKDKGKGTKDKTVSDKKRCKKTRIDKYKTTYKKSVRKVTGKKNTKSKVATVRGKLKKKPSRNKFARYEGRMKWEKEKKPRRLRKKKTNY